MNQTETVHARVGITRGESAEGHLALAITPNHLVGDHLRLSVLALMVDMAGGWEAHVAAAGDWVFTTDLSVRMRAQPAPTRISSTSRVLRAGRTTLQAAVSMLDRDGREFAYGEAGFSRQPRRHGDPAPPDMHESSQRWGKVQPLEQPLHDEIGIRVVDARAGAIEIELRDALRNPAGVMQGAMVAAAGEAAAEALLRAHRSAGAVLTDLDMRFLSMGRVGPIRSRARFLGDDEASGTVLVELVDAGAADRLMSVLTFRTGA